MAANGPRPPAGPATPPPPAGPKTKAALDSSPFDAIKQTDDNGEYWSARDMMPHLDYEKWERFTEAIARASCAAENAGQGGNHFRAAGKVIEGGRWGTQTVSDYHLTRFGAYLLAMNGNPRKAGVAQAQAYFAIKTREAEVAEGYAEVRTPGVELDELEVARRYVRAIEEKRAALARAEVAETALADAAPQIAGYNRFLNADGARKLGQAAKDIGWQETVLRSFLIAEKLIFVRQAFCGATQYEAYAEFARQHFQHVEHVVSHRWGDCAHFTLYVRPRGLELIRKRIAKRDAEIAAAITATAEPEPLPIST